MLDWSKIDNYHIFQRLINHLFALECGSPGFIPSSPYIGADGGWDGRYGGYYDYENEEGSWSIQSKWTLKSHTDAYSHLTKEIKEELQKARDNEVNHLRIATNAVLTVNQVKELEKLNDNGLITLKVWHREELERRIELQPYLRYHFFGYPQYPMFVPSCEYFSETEKHLLDVSVTEIPRFHDYLREAKLFIRSESKYIYLIHSPGGYGKSHLLKEIAEITHETDRERQLWMIWPGRREVQDAFQDEIVEGRKYLLILDDADRYLEEIKPLSSIVRSRSDSVKLILALRTSGFESVYNIISELRLEEHYDATKITDWSREDLVRLLRLVCGGEVIENEATIAASCSNPYLIVQIGRILRKDTSVDLKKIKEKIANEMYFEARKCLRDVQNLELENFLTYLVFLVPFSQNDNVFNFLTTKLSKNMEEAIERLQETGILRTIGRSYRFNPDMKGDLYLAHQLEKMSMDKIEKLVQELLPISPEKLFVNLEAAANYSENESIRNPLSRVIYSWVEKAKSTSADSKARKLDLAGKIANIVPECALALVRVYLNTEAPLKADDFGPVIRKLMRISSMRKDVVEIIGEIKMKGIEEHFDNWKPVSLIRDSVSPPFNNTNEIHETLDILAEWLHDPRSGRLTLISAGLSEVLAISHQYTRPTIGGMTFGAKVMKNTFEVQRMRDRAMQILKEMIRHQSLEVRLTAIEIAGNIGKGNLGNTPAENIPLLSKTNAEREEIIEDVGELISPQTDFKLLSAIEDLFLNWWAMDKPGTKRVEEYLRTFPRSIEYMVYRHFVSPQYAFEDFCSLERKAPIESKWHWFVHMSMDRFVHPKLEDFRQLIDSLSKKYKSETEIIDFLRLMDEKISQDDVRHNPPIITWWVSLKSRPFFIIREDRELWELVPGRFKNEIDFALADLNSDFIYGLADEVLSELPITPISKIDNFLRLLRRHDIPNSTLEDWLSKLAKQSPEIRDRVIRFADLLLPDKNKNHDSFFRLLCLTISEKGVLRDSTIENLGLVLHDCSGDLASFEGRSKESFRKELLCKLKDVPVFQWLAGELWNFVFNSLDSVIDFINYRVSKYIEAKGNGIVSQRYDIIPFEDDDCIESQIKSFRDYVRLVERVIEWYERGLGVHELRRLMEQAKSFSSADGKLYLEEYTDRQLEAGNARNVMIILRLLPFNEDTADLLIRIMEGARTSEELKEVEELLDHGMDTGMAWISKLGEPPPELIQKRELYKKIHENIRPGRIRILIERKIEEIDMLIDIQRKHDEELLYPRM